MAGGDLALRNSAKADNENRLAHRQKSTPFLPFATLNHEHLIFMAQPTAKFININKIVVGGRDLIMCRILCSTFNDQPSRYKSLAASDYRTGPLKF